MVHKSSLILIEKFNEHIIFFLQDHDGDVARPTSTTTTRVRTAASSSGTSAAASAPEVLWRQDSERRGRRGGGGEGRHGQRGRKSHSVKVRERRGGIAEIRDKTLDTD